MNLKPEIIWGLILVIALGNFLLRFSFLYLFGRVEAPQWLTRLLRFVPAAVLSALVIPALVAPKNIIDISLGNERLIAGLAGMLAAWYSKNILATLAVGLTIFWILRLI
ncbi:MAG: AzlD domain-containing protein [Anaerolineales bacterium]|nr:AzlD domain-containing protein [Anaerolineales bacterium]